MISFKQFLNEKKKKQNNSINEAINWIVRTYELTPADYKSAIVKIIGSQLYKECVKIAKNEDHHSTGFRSPITKQQVKQIFQVGVERVLTLKCKDIKANDHLGVSLQNIIYEPVEGNVAYGWEDMYNIINDASVDEELFSLVFDEFVGYKRIIYFYQKDGCPGNWWSGRYRRN